MNDFTKRSFTSGEISPSLRARVDLNKHQSALAVCKNFITLPEGGAINRPGFEYLGDESQSALIPFQFNQNDSYMLAFANDVLAVYRYGVKVHSLVSPYSYEDMTTAQFVQNADIITIAHIDHPLRTLTRSDHTDWEFEDVSFSASQSPPTQLTVNSTGTDSGSASKQYDYVVTSVLDGKESGQSEEVSLTTNALSETWGNDIQWSGSADSFNIYKSVSPSTNVYGWIGNSKTNRFIDYNIAPLSSEGVTKQTNPFNVLDVTMNITSGAVEVGQSLNSPNFTAEVIRISSSIYTLFNVVGEVSVGDLVESNRVSFDTTGDVAVGRTITGPLGSGNIVEVSGNTVSVDIATGSLSNGDAISISGSERVSYKVKNLSSSAILVIGEAFNSPTVTGTFETVTAQFGEEQAFTSTDLVGQLNIDDLIYRGIHGFQVVDIVRESLSSAGTITTDPVPSFSGSIATVNDISNPSVINQYQQRLMLANTELSPQTVYASRSGQNNYYDFRTSEPVGDSDSVEFTIASGQINEIRHIVSMKDMLLLTSSGVWLVTEGQNEVLTPSSVGVRRLSNYGSSKVRPVLVGGSALFIEAKGTRIRDLYNLQDYQSDDVSILSQHLFKDHEIISWCYQEDPHGIIWAVRSDGALLGLTYHKGHQVWGWHVHETQGEFVSVGCVTETDRDSVYACVNRDGNYMVERLSYRKDEDYDEFTFMDSYVRTTYEDEVSSIDRPSHLVGKKIVVLADGFVQWLDETDPIEFQRPVSNVLVGLSYASDIQTLEVDPQGSNTTGKVIQIPKLSVKFQNTVGGKFGQNFDKLLEGKWRSRSDDYGRIGLTNGDFTISIQPGWDDHGQVCIRQEEPLPMHILSITPTVMVGHR